MIKTTVSFDYDGTLDNINVQEYAKYLLATDVNVIICTSRTNNKHTPEHWNNDIKEMAWLLGVDEIIYTSGKDKYAVLQNRKILWHLDDDKEEVDLFNQHSPTQGILYTKHNHWRKECNRALIKEEN